MVKAIIFDCFGVLTTEGWGPFKSKYFAGQPEKLEKAVELNRMLDANLIEYQEGVRQIAGLAGVDAQELHGVLQEVVPNEELLNYIRADLKPKYRLGILSNVAGNWLDSFFSSQDIRLFDAIALSYQSGLLKPQPQAYESVTSLLEILPEECVFIDDLQRNTVGAQQIGMQTILYENFTQMKAELETILANPEG